MKVRIAILSFLIISSLSSCFAVDAPTSSAESISHEIWDKLLKKHVDAKGFVNYGGFKKDETELKKYLNLLSENAPNDKWSADEQLAYWINAYNAFTVQLILNYSDKKIKSIKDIGDKIKIPFINTPWDIKFIKIGGKTLDLNNIEHGIIRKKFNEPRIHFALVCAAKSCPSLRNEAYTASKLNEQLDAQGVDFLNDTFKNKITEKEAKLSMLFTWYGGDFRDKMPVINWVNKYSKIKITNATKVSNTDYNWELNGKL